MMKRTSTMRLLAFVLVFAVGCCMLACGGGGDSPAPRPTPQTVHWTKQWGTSSYDEAGAIAVDGSGNIYVVGSTGGNLDGNTNAGGWDVFLAKYDRLGNKLWTRLLGSSADDSAYYVVLDGSGDIYIAGDTSGNLDGNINAGGADVFLAKYDRLGNKLWTRLLGSSGDEGTSGIAVDGSGNIYIAGGTSGNLDGITNAGSYDAFLAKYDSSGNKLWTQLLGSSGMEWTYYVILDDNGGIYLTGTTSGNLDGNTNAGGEDAFLAKYDRSGNKLWTRLLGSSGGEWPSGIVVDGSGNIYIAGGTSGNLDGNTNAGYYDAFLAKYDRLGNKMWTRLLGSSGDEWPNGIVLDGSVNIYIAGLTSGRLDGNNNAGGYDAFLAKYDSSGNKLWTRLQGSSNDDWANIIVLEVNGGIYLAGVANGILDVRTSDMFYDAFLARYDSSGNKLWTQNLGSSGDEGVYGVATDGSGNIYIAGYTSGNLDGNTNAGDYDAFLAKYGPNGN